MEKSTKSKSQACMRTPAPVKHITKKDQLIKLLSSKAGREVKAISEHLGWQQHTTRAALSGLRKAGYDVSVERSKGGKLARYRISSARSASSRAKERALPNGA